MEENLLKMFAFLEGQVNKLKYGTISGNVMIINGKPVGKINITLLRRHKFVPESSSDDEQYLEK